MRSDASLVAAAIHSMHGTLQIAGVLLRAGRSIDLEGLDGDAARLCAAISVLAPADAAPLRPALHALLGELDRVAAILTTPD
jgi:hypothetical protein